MWHSLSLHSNLKVFLYASSPDGFALRGNFSFVGDTRNVVGHWEGIQGDSCYFKRPRRTTKGLLLLMLKFCRFFVVLINVQYCCRIFFCCSCCCPPTPGRCCYSCC